MRLITIGVAALVSAGPSCTEHSPSEVDCSPRKSPIATIASPLNGGVTSANYLALADTQLDAIVQVVSLDATGVELSSCTGVLVTRTQVLTAAHCSSAGSVAFEARQLDSTGRVSHVFQSTGTEMSDLFDLMLLALPDEAFADVTPIPIQTSPHEDWVGGRVQLAGTGYNPTLGTAARLWSVATVLEVSASSITVGANGYAGACLGDSGGPLLVRGPDGEPKVAGILSDGSVTCWAQDNYVRLDAAAEWLISALGSAVVASAGCGQLTGAGRCFESTAVWCEDAKLAAMDCTGGLSCGFDEKVAGFRCLPPEQDPCLGVSDLGSCEGGSAVSCVSGQRRSNTCLACGAACVISPASGRATCVLEEQEGAPL